MSEEVVGVAHNVHAGFVLYCMILLGWPDLDYLSGVVFGFPLSGCLDRPAISAPPPLKRVCYLGANFWLAASLLLTHWNHQWGRPPDTEKDTALYVLIASRIPPGPGSLTAGLIGRLGLVDWLTD